MLLIRWVNVCRDSLIHNLFLDVMRVDPWPPDLPFPQVLDEEAEVFIVKMWRLLIYETEAKKIGLVKWSLSSGVSWFLLGCLQDCKPGCQASTSSSSTSRSISQGAPRWLCECFAESCAWPRRGGTELRAKCMIPSLVRWSLVKATPEMYFIVLRSIGHHIYAFNLLSSCQGTTLLCELINIPFLRKCFHLCKSCCRNVLKIHKHINGW